MPPINCVEGNIECSELPAECRNMCEPVKKCQCPHNISNACGDHCHNIRNQQQKVCEEAKVCHAGCNCGDGGCSCKFAGYIQPPVPKSFKPNPTYQRPTDPLESETVYKKSYLPIDSCERKCVRPAPFIPSDNVPKPTAKIDANTVMKLSYMKHCGFRPPTPIVPPVTRLIPDGPLQSVTTQKHDYVAKPAIKRCPIIPSGHMQKSCAPLEKCTVMKLSFQPNDVTCNKPPKAFRPKEARTTTKCCPTDTKTVYKLSYQPLFPPAKEEYPWAKKTRHCPLGPIAKETTYKLSFMPNCNVKRVSPLYPVSALKTMCSNAKFDDKTIYRASYLKTCGAKRPTPIIHKSMLKLSGGKLDSATIYKMSFPGYCSITRSLPILPPQSELKISGPMETMTTQKLDFMPKPLSRRVPLIPVDSIQKCKAPFETKTINSMSYIPPSIQQLIRPAAFKPLSNYQKPTGPMETKTTHKLSFLPICPTPRRGPLPWAAKSIYTKPSAPMETLTVQKLSYGPPGQFVSGAGGCLGKCCRQCPFDSFSFPKAAIVK